MSIRLKLFLAIFAACLLCALVYSGVSFYSSVRLVRRGVDAHLEAAAQAVNLMMPSDYHDRLKRGEVSQQEYAQLQKRLADYQQRVGITFLYALVMHEGALRFSLDDDAPLLGRYENPSSDVLRAYELGEPVIDEGIDEDFGTRVRSAVLPYVSQGGTMDLLGADIAVEYIREEFRAGAIKFAILSLAGLFFAGLAAIILSHFISTPVRELAGFVRQTALENFQSGTQVPKALMPKSAHTRDETALLAGNFQKMLLRLDEYLKNFEREVAARERVEGELKMAGQIQTSFLPQPLPDNTRVSLAAQMRPAKQAGGDLYDYFYLDENRLCFAVGDVSGKGMAAALFMARVMTLLRSAALTAVGADKAAGQVNEVLCLGNDACMFVTLFVGTLDLQSGEIRFVNAGHNPPLLREAAGSCRYLQMKVDTPLGINENARFELQHTRLQAGQTLVLYTDGVTEAADTQNNLYGEQRLEKTACAFAADAPTKQMVQGIFTDVDAFADGAEQSDDITLMVLRRL